MYVFVVGMERCGTHSIIDIVNEACNCSHDAVHEENPYLCREALLAFHGQEFRTDDLKLKVKLLRKKKHKLVCEANHRFGYLITFLARQFPDCKIIFLYRDPLATIISRISIWSYYPEYLDMYPEFYKNKIIEAKADNPYNICRISPPKTAAIKYLPDLYVWEWLENYRFVREQLTCIPSNNRLVMVTEDLTSNYDKIFDFIGREYFYNSKSLNSTKVKSDSIYGHKRRENNNETINFAKGQVGSYAGSIISNMLSELKRMPSDIDIDLLNMDRHIMEMLRSHLTKVKMV